LVNDAFETREAQRAARRRPIDATVVDQVGRLFIPVSAILDLRDRVGHDLSEEMRDAISAYSETFSAWLLRAAS
jgi:hypothetical protein